MTKKELIELINKYPDDMEIGGCGHYGEILQIENIYLYKSSGTILSYENPKHDKFIVINIESPGREPE